MIARRDFLIGAACCLGSGAAYALKPRRQTTLMDGGKKLNEILPPTIEGWTSRDVSDLVAPETPDSLAARLYGETVGRIYHQQSTGDQVIMLMAHGDVENNELQLHRPEVCYPAFGFAIVENTPVSLAFPKGVTVPCRRLVVPRLRSIVFSPMFSKAIYSSNQACPFGKTNRCVTLSSSVKPVKATSFP